MLRLLRPRVGRHSVCAACVICLQATYHKSSLCAAGPCVCAPCLYALPPCSLVRMCIPHIYRCVVRCMCAGACTRCLCACLLLLLLVLPLGPVACALDCALLACAACADARSLHACVHVGSVPALLHHACGLCTRCTIRPRCSRAPLPGPQL